MPLKLGSPALVDVSGGHQVVRIQDVSIRVAPVELPSQKIDTHHREHVVEDKSHQEHLGDRWHGADHSHDDNPDPPQPLSSAGRSQGSGGDIDEEK